MTAVPGYRERDCAVLLDMLRDPTCYFDRILPEKPWLDLLYLDLVHKSEGLAPEVYRNVRHRGLWFSVPGAIRFGGRYEELQEIASAMDPPTVGARINTGTEAQRIKCDIVVVTVIPQEFDAACQVFCAKRALTGPLVIREREYREFAVRQAGGEVIRGFVVMCGRARNVGMANLCRDVMENFEVNALLLVGIAAGNRREGIGLGDVIGSTEVLDVAGGRLEIAGGRLGRTSLGRLVYLLPEFVLRFARSIQPRWTVEKPKGRTGVGFDGFSMEEDGKDFGEEVTRELDRLKASFGGGAGKGARYHHARPIASGEQLVADGSVLRFARLYNDKLGGVEMEGAGFAVTCNLFEKPWYIFRGVSDFGDPSKSDNWHEAAAVGAAVAAREFLERGFRRVKERDF